MSVKTGADKNQSQPEQGHPQWSDAAISIVALGVAIAALVTTYEWPDDAARFPQIISTVGILCCTLFLIKFGWDKWKVRRASQGTARTADTQNDDSREADVDAEYVFATATPRSWIRSVLWIALFFLMFYAFGLFVAAGLFALVYLQYEAGTKWYTTICYSLALSGLMWLLFDSLLGLPLPGGSLVDLM